MSVRSRKLKLIVFGPGHPFRGGIATTTTALVQAMRDRDHEVLFLTPRRQYPTWLYPGGNGGRDAEACPLLDGTRAALDPLGPLAWPKGRRAARSANADGWIVPYWTWAWAPWWTYLLAGSRPPAIGVVHNPVDHDAGPVQRLAARAVLSRCQGLFTHAGVLEENLTRRYPDLPVGEFTEEFARVLQAFSRCGVKFIAGSDCCDINGVGNLRYVQRLMQQAGIQRSQLVDIARL